MTSRDHEDYAADLLVSLRDDGPEIEVPDFVPNPRQSRNAAKAMTAILCHGLFKQSKHRPIHKKGKNYEWKQGTFNCRNIADRGYFWTNMRLGVADEMHEAAKRMPVAYLLACCEPLDTTMNTWAIPEPLLYDALASLRFEEAGHKYTIEIHTDKQRIERCKASPDLAPFYRSFQLETNEMVLLEGSRKADTSAKRERAVTRGEEDLDDEANQFLASAAQQLNEAGAFDPSGVADARERVLSSIVRRRGQPAFRHRLLAAYNGKCAITGCDVEAVLDASHIVSYRGPDTNHPANGLLLRTDLHTLFDFKLVAVDVRNNDLARLSQALSHLLREVSRTADQSSKQSRKPAQSRGAQATSAGKRPIVRKNKGVFTRVNRFVVRAWQARIKPPLFYVNRISPVFCVPTSPLISRRRRRCAGLPGEQPQ